MQNPNVSVIIPCIRPKNLIKLYASLERACVKYSFELVVPGPYLLPEEIMKKGNVKFIHTYASPTVACQMATLMCQGEYLYNTTDDGLVQEGVIDEAIETHKQMHSPINVINMRYDEGVLNPDTLEPLKPTHEEFPINYWTAWTHPTLRLPGIKQHWQTSLHYFMRTNTFLFFGGYDCGFEYLNHATHDFMFRIQTIGAQILHSRKVAFLCSHLPVHTGDHAPVHDAQTSDTQRFNNIYFQADATLGRISINYDNWKTYPTIWSRRFDENNLQLSPR